MAKYKWTPLNTKPLQRRGCSFTESPTNKTKDSVIWEYLEYRWNGRKSPVVPEINNNGETTKPEWKEGKKWA